LNYSHFLVYGDTIMDLKPADIILTRGRNILSKMILYVLRLFQDDPVNFNHVLMVCGENLGIEADKKIRYVDLDKIFQKAAGYKIIRRIDLTDKQRKNIVKKTKFCLGQKYGYRRLVRQLFDQIFHTNWFTKNLKSKKHICSGLIAWAYYVVCKIKFNDIGWRSVEPDDIEDCSDKRSNLWMIVVKNKKE